MSQLVHEDRGLTAEPGEVPRTAPASTAGPVAPEGWQTPSYTVVETALEVTAYARADR